MLLQEGHGSRGAAADVLVREPHELAGEGHQVAGGLPIVLQMASRGSAQSRVCPRQRPCPRICSHSSWSLTTQAGHPQAPPSAGSLRLTPCRGSPGRGQLGGPGPAPPPCGPGLCSPPGLPGAASALTQRPLGTDPPVLVRGTEPAGIVEAGQTDWGENSEWGRGAWRWGWEAGRWGVAWLERGPGGGAFDAWEFS